MRAGNLILTIVVVMSMALAVAVAEGGKEQEAERAQPPALFLGGAAAFGFFDLASGALAVEGAGWASRCMRSQSRLKAIGARAAASAEDFPAAQF